MNYHLINKINYSPGPSNVQLMVDTAIQWINLYTPDNAVGSLTLIHWIVIYPVYWAIQHLNNWGQLNYRKLYWQLSQLVQFLLFWVAFCLMTVTRKPLDQLQNPVFAKIFRGECDKRKYVLPKLIFPEVEWGRFKPKTPLLGDYIWILTTQTHFFMTVTTVVVV